MSSRVTSFREYKLPCVVCMLLMRLCRYIVAVKVGKPTERTKPGNRGKRDSQILLMQYLNRVHFDAPMCPLELEIYHQMRNVIGIDPAFYEYIFTVDADTTVTPDSLNRLVASAADDSSIIGICGETKLDNEEGSWWTMIQVCGAGIHISFSLTDLSRCTSTTSPTTFRRRSRVSSVP